ncbi:MAG: SDR family NAD(P)-dependent oxidoreductase, partial [Solirubrobacteraceae bacterium]
MPRTVVVLGARNLGGAIADHFLELGWNAAAVARSEDTLEGIRRRGALALAADASDPVALTGALRTARRELGSLDAVVNAVSAARPPADGPFGGGQLAAADLEAFRGWTVAVAEQAFVFLSCGARALRDSGAGTLVQITGGSARRAMPGKGLWAAGAFATRALVQAAAQELRSEGIHVALLAVDATIESPKTAAVTAGLPRDA